MSSSSSLLNSFEQFSSFGVSKSSQALNAAPTMDNSHFAKMCRDSKIIGKNCTTTDIDIVFKKVLVKGERRIDFAQFEQSLQLLADIKFRNDPAGLAKIKSLVTAAVPSANATQAKATGIFSKLTDHNLYTGSHKQRFDESGKGKGLEGRDTITKTSDLSQIVDRKSGPAKRLATSSTNSLTGSKVNLTGSKAALTSKSNLAATSSKPAPKSKDAVTAIPQKQRLDESGRGRAVAGRN